MGQYTSVGEGIPVMKSVFKEASRFLDDDVIFLALTTLEIERTFTSRELRLENLAAGFRYGGDASAALKEEYKRVFKESQVRLKEHFEKVFSNAAEAMNSGVSDESYVRLLYFVNSLFVHLAKEYPLKGENKMDLLATWRST